MFVSEDPPCAVRIPQSEQFLWSTRSRLETRACNVDRASFLRQRTHVQRLWKLLPRTVLFITAFI